MRIVLLCVIMLFVCACKNSSTANDKNSERGITSQNVVVQNSYREALKLQIASQKTLISSLKKIKTPEEYNDAVDVFRREVEKSEKIFSSIRAAGADNKTEDLPEDVIALFEEYSKQQRELDAVMTNVAEKLQEISAKSYNSSNKTEEVTE